MRSKVKVTLGHVGEVCLCKLKDLHQTLGFQGHSVKVLQGDGGGIRAMFTSNTQHSKCSVKLAFGSE